LAGSALQDAPPQDKMSQERYRRSDALFLKEFLKQPYEKSDNWLQINLAEGEDRVRAT
jgi:hypothetical protein